MICEPQYYCVAASRGYTRLWKYEEFALEMTGYAITAASGSYIIWDDRSSSTVFYEQGDFLGAVSPLPSYDSPILILPIVNQDVNIGEVFWHYEFWIQMDLLDSYEVGSKVFKDILVVTRVREIDNEIRKEVIYFAKYIGIIRREVWVEEELKYLFNLIDYNIVN